MQLRPAVLAAALLSGCAASGGGDGRAIAVLGPPVCRPGPLVPEGLPVDPGDAACRAWIAGAIDDHAYAAAIVDRLDALLIAHAERALVGLGPTAQAGPIRDAFDAVRRRRPSGALPERGAASR